MAWWLDAFMHKAEVIFNRITAIELRQCHNAMSENEALRLLESEFWEWKPDLSMDYLHHQFEYLRFKLHTARMGKHLKSNDQLMGELLVIHLMVKLLQQYDYMDEIKRKLRFMAKQNWFFFDLVSCDTIEKLMKELHEVEGKLRKNEVAFCALGDRPFYLPGVGSPKRGWLSKCPCADCVKATEAYMAQ